MNPIHDSLSTIREALDTYQRRANECLGDLEQMQSRDAMAAHQTLQDALSENTPLAAVAEGFCSEVEAVSQSRSQPGKGGQQVPCHSQLRNTGPSAMTCLERYARDFRAALDRSEYPPCTHNVRGGCFECGTALDLD